jgi:CheY-like chemotaxis protein
MTITRPPGGSVFLVEDEVMIRMMVADMLEELGYSISAEAGDINEAIKLAQSAEFGYGSSGLPEQYRDRPALQKPFQLETLARMIDAALKSTTV